MIARWLTVDKSCKAVGPVSGQEAWVIPDTHDRHGEYSLSVPSLTPCSRDASLHGASSFAASVNAELVAAGHKNEAYCLFAAFITADPKGKFVVCGSEDHSIYLWDLNKKEVRLCLCSCVSCVSLQVLFFVELGRRTIDPTVVGCLHFGPLLKG